jgi:pantetheine-phosphate adenylyltransferase
VRSAIYPGTFDPVTLGHLDLIRRARTLVDGLTVSVATESGKDTLFSVEERIDLIREATADMPDVRVTAFTGLLVRHAADVGAGVILRGLRAVSDFEYEFQMALMNRHLAPGIEILFMVPGGAYTFLSSSLVREVAMLGGDVSSYVPANVLEALGRKFRRREP